MTNQYPKLAGEKQQNLLTALMRAYRDESQLGMMTYYYLEVSLNTINGNNHEEQVHNLIEWAKEQGKLRELVIAASKRNPGNPELRICVKELLPVLLDDIDKDLLSPELLTPLIDIFKDFEDQDFTVVKDCCVQTVPDISDHRAEQLQDTQNEKLALAVRWLIVLGLLLKDYRKKDGIPYIVEFVTYLQRKTELNQRTSEHLFRWLETVPPSKRKNITKPNITSLQGNLLIFVRPQVTQKSFKVNSFITINNSSDDSLKFLVLKEPVSSYEKIQESLSDWVCQVEKKLGDETDKLGFSYDLTIEFFLPFEYLAEAVEQWKVNLSRFGQIAIGKKHQVVVRSLDRLEDSYLLNELHKRWEKFSHNPNKTKIEHLDCLVGCDWESLTERLEEFERIALKLTCGISTCKILENSTDFTPLFKSILNGGTPIVLWSRQCNLSDVSSKMDQLLDSKMLCNPNQLLKEVDKIRKAAKTSNNQDFGHHLGILCDEPQRLRQIKQLLKNNQLWEMSA
ncbi:MAG: hypothetical protein KME60_00435 [Cyanomargarita calcarea GSE-NOS-MK-12-04C]|uniref:Uncharacterized protein n=1 Tax=Cyanomargarita calcarea GSE-NOS-MK-12-04C TaxID=2839659 RepID=A0A951QHU3_9CYAN|nr:hypothetical protein [Cyanomargarita calcarea GSE-NOS-MK-12-04C]